MTVLPDSVTPESAKVVSSVLCPLVSGPLTLPVSSFAAIVGAGALLSKVYVLASDEIERFPAASAAFAVIAWLAYSTSPTLGVNVTVLPTGGATENFDVISVVPANSMAVVASAPIVTTIVPVFEFGATVGAATGALLSNV